MVQVPKANSDNINISRTSSKKPKNLTIFFAKKSDSEKLYKKMFQKKNHTIAIMSEHALCFRLHLDYTFQNALY